MSKSRKPRNGCGDESGEPMSTKAPTPMGKKREYSKKKYLHQDFVMEELLTKVPVGSLLRFGAVSKQWYKSIHIDKRLTDSHFLQSQKKPKFIFSLLNKTDGVVTDETSFESSFFEFPTGGRDGDIIPFLRLGGFFNLDNYGELVGYCNGFPCMAVEDWYGISYTILQPNRGDFLHIYHPSISGECIFHAHTICHGFGFDSLANEYKLVSVFRTPHQQLNIHVFTLGTRSCRNVTTTSTHVAYHGHPITWIRASTSSDRSAIFCNAGSESLVWKVITTIGGGEGANDSENKNSNNQMEMLLSFNLYDEKFSFIQLPSISTTDEQRKHLFVAYPRPLEFKGFPCIAQLEKTLLNGTSDCNHRRLHDHHDSNSTICCCCCKVHLYLFKGKVKQAWVKEESFDVRVNSHCKSLSDLPPDPCCFCIGNTSTPPTRILSFSDQILLYWFDGKYLQVNNLRSKKLTVVMPQHAVERDFFDAKMKAPSHTCDDGDNIYCSNMDYQLHCQGENFLSLQSFVPEGVAGVDAAEILELNLETEDPPYTASVYVHRGSGVYFPFF